MSLLRTQGDDGVISNIPLHAAIPITFIQAARRLGVSAFVNMSAALSALGICRISVSPSCIFSFTKWCLMSMCRVLADDD
ncbi:hypothetical protein T02_14818 [Trichinella nativa]|uniref:Uncharacterized protein n=1 Tax=Trichinella nativa TaxID=6335 RepID=A0A0V1LQE1_9BILA|nr:hypothetical protein T02_14818 [Trichinella nativa]